MNEQDKKLLIQSISLHLPFGVWAEWNGFSGRLNDINMSHHFNDTNFPQQLNAWTDFFEPNEPINITLFKPLLRSENDMTAREKQELDEIITKSSGDPIPPLFYRLEHHFDVTGLLPRGLATEVGWNRYFSKDDVDY